MWRDSAANLLRQAFRAGAARPGPVSAPANRFFGLLVPSYRCYCVSAATGGGDGGGNENAMTYAEAKRLMRLVNVGALKERLGMEDKEVYLHPDKVPVPRQDDVVGFEDEAEKIIGYIKEDRDELDVISVIGMPGLGKTTLAWKIFHDPYIQYEFPPKLRILTLADTFLDWSHMPTLGLLGNLEVLKLKDNAFKGKNWSATDGGFRHLEVLHIGRTDLVIWKASAHHFPRLRCLMLRNCEKLQEIPLELADIPSFELLDLYRTHCAAVSAQKIQEKKIADAAVTFKLSVFPPVNRL